MTHTVDFASWTPGYQAMRTLDQAVRSSGLEVSLQELVKIRASQINQCAYCLDMHTKDARASGETEQRVYGLAAWREAPYYTDRERAALALTEAVTLIGAAHGVPDEVLAEVERHFSPEEVIALLYAVVCINAWNRLAIAGRSPEPGSYRVRERMSAVPT